MNALSRGVRAILSGGWGVRVSLGFFIVLLIAAFIGPLTGLLDPYSTDTTAILQPPSSAHILGTDGAGRDVLSRVLFGARTSITVGVLATAILILMAVLIGSLAGYYGGVVDSVLSRIIDAVLSIPLLLLVTVFVALLRPGIVTVILVIGFLGWPATARILRAETLSVSQRSFVTAGRLSGQTDLGIIRHHILPNLTPLLVVATTLSLGTAILMESTISFLGLGIKPPEASLGSIVSLALEPGAFRATPWTWLPAAVVLAALVVSVNLIGDALRGALDPSRNDEG